MVEDSLTNGKCEPCSGNTPKLDFQEISEYLSKINNLEIVDFAASVDGDILVIKGKIYNNDFFSRLSPVILISGYNSNNEVYNFFKLKAENQIIKPGTYNYFRYETTEFDNMSSETLNEFNAELSSESINLEFR